MGVGRQQVRNMDVVLDNATDTEHFVTCGVCFCEFDEETRKPKFLQCAHTVCLNCLQKICQHDVISCPFCRKNFVGVTASSLPNNSYALHIIKLKKERETTGETLGSLDCQTSGITARLATALEMRYDFQEQLDVVMKTVYEAGAQVKKLQVENCLHIAELMSVMKMNSPPVTANVTPTVLPTYTFPSPTLPGVPAPNNKFVLGQSSIFILRLFQSGALKGEIRIRPAPTFHPEFLQHLGKFCYKSPKDFITTVTKAHAGVFALFSVSHFLFHPVVSNYSSNPWPGTPNASPGEVGIILNKSSLPGSTLSSSAITSWSFILSVNPVNHQHKNVISSLPVEIFGHVINTSDSPNEVVMELSKSKKSEVINYTISLESQ